MIGETLFKVLLIVKTPVLLDHFLSIVGEVTNNMAHVICPLPAFIQEYATLVSYIERIDVYILDGVYRGLIIISSHLTIF